MRDDISDITLSKAKKNLYGDACEIGSLFLRSLAEIIMSQGIYVISP
jgi:hypothetical protein